MLSLLAHYKGGNKMKIKTETIIRTAVLILALINQILTATGHSIIPISDEQLTEGITLFITIAASLWAWWKNNSFTKEAIEADELFARLRAENNARK